MRPASKLPRDAVPPDAPPAAAPSRLVSRSRATPASHETSERPPAARLGARRRRLEPSATARASASRSPKRSKRPTPKVYASPATACTALRGAPRWASRRRRRACRRRGEHPRVRRSGDVGAVERDREQVRPRRRAEDEADVLALFSRVAEVVVALEVLLGVALFCALRRRLDLDADDARLRRLADVQRDDALLAGDGGGMAVHHRVPRVRHRDVRPAPPCTCRRAARRAQARRAGGVRGGARRLRFAREEAPRTRPSAALSDGVMRRNSALEMRVASLCAEADFGQVFMAWCGRAVGGSAVRGGSLCALARRRLSRLEDVARSGDELG